MPLAPIDRGYLIFLTENLTMCINSPSELSQEKMDHLSNLLHLANHEFEPAAPSANAVHRNDAIAYMLNS